MTLDDPHRDGQPAPGFWKSKIGLVTIGFLMIALFFLLTEHRAHVFGALPWLLILACPLMHLFMHRGHGHGGQHRHREQKPDQGGDS
jgi:hypothetical protein